MRCWANDEKVENVATGSERCFELSPTVPLEVLVDDGHEQAREGGGQRRQSRRAEALGDGGRALDARPRLAWRPGLLELPQPTSLFTDLVLCMLQCLPLE